MRLFLLTLLFARLMGCGLVLDNDPHILTDSSTTITADSAAPMDADAAPPVDADTDAAEPEDAGAPDTSTDSGPPPDACVTGCPCETSEDCPGDVCSEGVCDPDSRTCLLVARDDDHDGFPIGGACGGTDCDDEEDSVNPGISFDGCNRVDDDCDMEVDEDDPPYPCWTDSDGDGFTSLPLVRMCLPGPTCPSGFVNEPPSDCDDGNPQVYLGQPDSFGTPFDPGGGPSFDYNCDGVDEQEFPSIGSCSSGTTADCTSGSGFVAPVPPCGAAGAFIVCAPTSGGCVAGITTRTQRCH